MPAHSLPFQDRTHTVGRFPQAISPQLKSFDSIPWPIHGGTQVTHQGREFRQVGSLRLREGYASPTSRMRSAQSPIQQPAGKVAISSEDQDDAVRQFAQSLAKCEKKAANVLKSIGEWDKEMEAFQRWVTNKASSSISPWVASRVRRLTGQHVDVYQQYRTEVSQIITRLWELERSALGLSNVASLKKLTSQVGQLEWRISRHAEYLLPLQRDHKPTKRQSESARREEQRSRTLFRESERRHRHKEVHRSEIAFAAAEYVVPVAEVERGYEADREEEVSVVSA